MIFGAANNEFLRNLTVTDMVKSKIIFKTIVAQW